MNKLIDNYINDLLNDNTMQELLTLKKIIDIKYKDLIIRFKNKEANYLEAKPMASYYPNFNSLQNEFKEAKAELYSKEEVINYFKLEKALQAKIDDDINELKGSISNKFSLSNKLF